MNYWIESLPDEGWQGWLFAAAVAFLLSLFIKVTLHFTVARLRRLKIFERPHWDDAAFEMIGDFQRWVLFFWIFFPLMKRLNASPGTVSFFKLAVVAATMWQVALWGFRVLRTWRSTTLRKRMTAQASSAAAIGLLYAFVQSIFVAALILTGLGQLGVDIRALLAGLGIGGIAVALAAQNILGDLLASLSIALDRPFVVGDFIVAGNDMGTVEDIGIKTTRVRSLTGEQLIFANKDLIQSRIHNFQRMYERRVVQKFGLSYTTPIEKIRRIPEWIAAIVGKYPKLRLERCHFFQYGASSLDFELVFWVAHPDYNLFMDLQQSVLLDIAQKFMQERIEFALPTQKMVMQPKPDELDGVSGFDPRRLPNHHQGDAKSQS